MKKHFVLLIVAFMVTGNAISQMTFTVKPGLNLNGANFGIKRNNFEPFIGLQFLNFTTKYLSNGPGYNEDSKTKTHIYMPFVGCKIFLSDKGSIRSSLNASFFKPIIFGKQTFNGQTDDSYKDELKTFNIWGGEVGFGSEYLFNEYFSIGGEFGFRYGFYTRKDVSNPGNSYTDAMNLNMTYVSLSLNFYFPDKKKD